MWGEKPDFEIDASVRQCPENWRLVLNWVACDDCEHVTSNKSHLVDEQVELFIHSFNDDLNSCIQRRTRFASKA
jgi:hypothetical protein